MLVTINIPNAKIAHNAVQVKLLQTEMGGSTLGGGYLAAGLG